MTAVTPDPYRALFPLGVLFGLAGAALWPLHALGWIPYPAPLHWTLMIQGFQHCFILGFLLTAMPSFLHAKRTNPTELAIAATAMVAFLAFSLASRPAWAQAAYVSTILLVAAMGARRQALFPSLHLASASILSHSEWCSRSCSGWAGSSSRRSLR